MWRNINSRDILGLCLWFMVALVTGWVAYTIMIAREIYQFFRYRLESFEWEDVVRYSLVITLGWLVKSCLEQSELPTLHLLY